MLLTGIWWRGLAGANPVAVLLGAAGVAVIPEARIPGDATAWAVLNIVGVFDQPLDNDLGDGMLHLASRLIRLLGGNSEHGNEKPAECLVPGDDILRELTYTGRIFNGVEAREMGFVTKVVEDPRAAALEV